MAYAEKTSVGTSQSVMEIERTLTKYGADQFMYGTKPGSVAVGFVMGGRQVRIVVPLPDKTDKQFWLTDTGRDRSETAALKEWDQACRQRYRSLALVVKAKLEAVEAGITTFEEEFMAHLVLPGGETVGQRLLPEINEAQRTGKLPPLLPHVG
ncbi:hypothetical protein [Arsukibacterium indicum]|uniref:Uncharacterized protein n=1 Tax=Arsukibacterium indicum TaxID=2848612 RepID=A0ABS6MGM8_9GAMM|nr:hypothetical protein [Arsukibacterium indicum]MBV2127963.1 hypothetical protein [Arsukibacterium indicum]